MVVSFQKCEGGYARLILPLVAITILILAVASLFDWRVGEVPDWLCYSLIAVSLGLSAIFSIQEGITFFWHSLAGFSFGLIVGVIFYYGGVWGGADSKLLMGMGAVIGLSLDLLIYFCVLLVIIFIWKVLNTIFKFKKAYTPAVPVFLVTYLLYIIGTFKYLDVLLG